jgi:hypothetical protein
LKVLQLLEGSLGGALVGVEAALETFEAVFEIVEGGAEGVLAGANVAAIVGIFKEGIVPGKGVLPEVGFDGAESADFPFVVNEGIDEVPLTWGDGVELGVVLGGQLREIIGVFAADDVGLRMDAGFQSVQAGGSLAGVGTGAGGLLRIQAIRRDLFFRCHK